MDAQQVGAAECAVGARVDGEVADGGEHLAYPVGVVLGEPFCLGEGFGLPDDLVAQAVPSPKIRR
ncbi:hypothetical protein ABZ461_34290 [Actinacidiphila glaucinigra]|uniref:hypothetical protein n=1 Tax=Actinacidiphila glaucinigra TaxID=235986 RepID=UPI0034080B52